MYNPFNRKRQCYLCAADQASGEQELVETLERNTQARRENTEAMNRLAEVVQALTPHAVPTYIQTSHGIRMNNKGELS